MQVSSSRARHTVPLPAAVAAAAVLLLTLLVMFFQWNWLRGPLASAISDRVHRPVAITGDLKVHPWSGTPWASIEGLAIGNPAWAGGGAMARLPRLTVRWRWGPLLKGQVVLPMVSAQRPTVRLFSDASGRQNWNFGSGRTQTRPQPSPIEHLLITGGAINFVDAKQRLNFAGTISTDETQPTGTGLSTVSGVLVVGGPAWAGPQPLARAPRLVVKTRLLPLMAGRLELPLVEADGPSLRLISDATGRANWQSDSHEKAKPVKLPPIDHLIISNGAISYADAKQRVSFVGTISTREGAAAPGGLSTIRGALVVGGATWAGPQPMVRAPRVVVQVRLLPAIGGKLELPLIEADGPAVHLVRDASGRANWQTDPNQKPKPFKVPPINHLIINDGALTYDDAKTKTKFSGTVSSSETLQGKGRGTFQLQGSGRLNAAPFLARITGGALLNVDSSRPYPFDAQIVAGATKLAANGIIAHPFDFGQISGQARVSGPDFSDLYHLTGIALPNTPPYQLSAGFAVAGQTYSFRSIAGRMGDSDLAGTLRVDNTSGRPFLTADLASQRLKLADLAAVTGGVPKNTAGHTLSPAQKATSAKLKVEQRFLPDSKLDVTRIRTTDASLTYRAASVDAPGLPIRALSLKMGLDHGLLTVDPLALTLPQGNLAGLIRLDARGARPIESIDIRLTDARLENLVGGGGAKSPLAGALYGRVELTGAGDSVRAAAATANGTLTMVIPGGEIRQAFAELLGINATKGLFLLLAKNQTQTPIRCAVADFRAVNGILTAQHIVFDTGVVLAEGKGEIDLRNETVNLQIAGKPKQFRLVHLGVPITVKGPLIEPKVGVSVAKAASQLAVAGVLGVVVAPLAVILPFVNPGLAKNADCAALMSGASERGVTVRAQ